MTLLSIGTAISFHSADDWIAAAFYAEAAVRAHAELQKVHSDCLPVRRLLVAMTLAKSTLWRVVDAGDKTFVDPLYTLNRDLANYIPAQDPKLRNAKVHGFVGTAECLWLKGEFFEAQETLAPLDSRTLTVDQVRAVAWIRGLIFLSMNRYEDARDQFQIVVNSPRFLYSENASRWLAVCLAHCSKVTEANAAFDNWVRNYHPTVKLAARVLELMDLHAPLIRGG